MNDDSGECRQLREDWYLLRQRDLTVGALQAFYARYKYLIMSRHLASYHDIGTLLANASQRDIETAAARLYELMQRALAMPATAGGNVNALLHISGYLKQQLSAEEKRRLQDCIERHGRGEVDASVPNAVLREYLQRFPNAYIEQQVFLSLPLEQ